jgi:hypothetical protein
VGVGLDNKHPLPYNISSLSHSGKDKMQKILHIGVLTDHSISMGVHQKAAADDLKSYFNGLVEGFANSDDLVFVHHLGHSIGLYESGSDFSAIDFSNHSQNVMFFENVHLFNLLEQSRDHYAVSGRSTRLDDAIITIIKKFEKIEQECANDKDTQVDFLVMCTSDGENNDSAYGHYTNTHQNAMRLVEAKSKGGNWTFTFRAPKGSLNTVRSEYSAFPPDNILGWDTSSSKGLEIAATTTNSSMSGYIQSRSTGLRSVSTFFTANALTEQDRKTIEKMTDVSKLVTVWQIYDTDNGKQISEFCNERLKAFNSQYKPGAAFYELQRKRNKIQHYKKLIILDKTTGKMYSNEEARTLLGIPTDREVTLAPNDFGDFRVFVQSTSNNRKLESGFSLLYWPA